MLRHRTKGAIAVDHDAVVIGSGHNGLTCAGYLARAGLKVLVLEKHHSIGGMTNTEELTLPGFRSDTHAICLQFANFSPVPTELELHRYGFRLLHPDPCVTQAFPDGRAVSVHRDIDRTCDSIGQFSEADANAWRGLYQDFLQQDSAIAAAFNTAPAGFAVDVSRGAEQYRFDMQSVRSWCAERFTRDEVRLLLGSWAVHGGVAPDDVGGGSLGWLFSMVIQRYGNNVVKGGMANLAAALAGCIEAHGGEIRTRAQVRRIVVDNGTAVAVELVDGERIDGIGLVASSAHPRQLALDLLPRECVGEAIADKMRRYELGQSVMTIHLALASAVEFKAAAASRSVYVHPSPPTLDYFAAVFQHARAGLLPAEPFALICNDSVADPSRVPPGRALMKLVVQPVPYAITGDAAGTIEATDWADAKEPFADRVIDVLARHYVPDLAEKILDRVVCSPVDLEQTLPSAVHGTNDHGAMVPYQAGALRPIPELGQYRSPVANVYLCGSGSHPGPGVTFAPGRNAAQVIRGDLGLA